MRIGLNYRKMMLNLKLKMLMWFYAMESITKIGGDFEHFSNDLCKPIADSANDQESRETYKIYNSPISNAAEIYQLDKRDRSGEVKNIFFLNNYKENVDKYLEEEINRIYNNIKGPNHEKKTINRTTRLLKTEAPLNFLQGKNT